MSPEFITLQLNIATLRVNFLAFAARPDGEYTDAERLNCRAFIAFSHAEVEHYLESRSLRLLDDAVRCWQERQEASITALAVLAFRRRNSIAIPDDPRSPGRQNTLATILMEAFVSQKNVINRNHGIKPKNFAEIFIPLGVTDADVEETLIIQLGNSGTHRGTMVHSSSDVSLPMIRDPFVDEEKDINFLVSELLKFDAKLEMTGLIHNAAPNDPEVPAA